MTCVKHFLNKTMTEPLAQPASPASLVVSSADEAAVNEIVGRGPAGTFAVAGIATAIVVAIYFAFYFFAYLPRGIVQ